MYSLLYFLYTLPALAVVAALVTLRLPACHLNITYVQRGYYAIACDSTALH